MEVIIETYKGFEIRFDTERESFVCDIDDKRSVKQSYPALKKFIADWAKENELFKKFKIEAIPERYREKEPITIIGKHGNGNFLGLIGGKTKQVSSYEFKTYMIVNDLNKPLWDELEAHEERVEENRKELNASRKAIEAKFIVKTLKEYIKEQGL